MQTPAPRVSPSTRHRRVWRHPLAAIITKASLHQRQQRTGSPHALARGSQQAAMLLRGGLCPPRRPALRGRGSQGPPRPAPPPAAAAAAAAMSRSASPGRGRAPTSPLYSRMSWRNPTIFLGQAAVGASGAGAGCRAAKLHAHVRSPPDRCTRLLTICCLAPADLSLPACCLCICQMRAAA